RDVRLDHPTATAEVRLDADGAGVGFVTVAGDLFSDQYVTLSDGASYTATHGRHEFVERYPGPIRVLLAAARALAAVIGRTVPLFVKDQYLYLGAGSRSHVLLMNLSNVTNHVRVVVTGPGERHERLVTVAPMGSHLLDVTTLGLVSAESISVVHARFEANAWFNLYVVGAGRKDLDGPLSFMHVK